MAFHRGNGKVLPKPIIRTDANPTVMRIVPELAVEIGLNESILLLQIAHWISITNHLRDGRYWTYQSVRDIKEKAFPFWGVATINRVVKSLEDAGYITIGNYNERSGDKTRWFSLCVEKLQELTSVTVVFITPMEEKKPRKPKSKVFQDETGLFQNGTPSTQNGTTLPESTTENTPERDTANAAPPSLGSKKDAFMRSFDGTPLYAAYLEAFKDAGKRAPVTSNRNGTIHEHEGLLAQIDGATPETVKAYTLERLASGRAPAFRFLPEDMPAWLDRRESEAAPAPPVRGMSPPIEEDVTPMTPEVFRALRAAMETQS